MLEIKLLNGLGFLTCNRYCYQAVVDDLIQNVQRPGWSLGQKLPGWVRSRVRNPDPLKKRPHDYA